MVVLTWSEWSEPHVQIVICEVLSINQFVNRSGVSAISWQDIHIGREGEDLVIMDVDWHAKLVKHLNSSEPKIVHVSPSFKNVDLEFFTLGQSWNNVLSLISRLIVIIKVIVFLLNNFRRGLHFFSLQKWLLFNLCINQTTIFVAFRGLHDRLLHLSRLVLLVGKCTWSCRIINFETHEVIQDVSSPLSIRLVTWDAACRTWQHKLLRQGTTFNHRSFIIFARWGVNRLLVRLDWIATPLRSCAFDNLLSLLRLLCTSTIAIDRFSTFVSILDPWLLLGRTCHVFRVVEPTKVCHFKKVKTVEGFVDKGGSARFLPLLLWVRHLNSFVDGVDCTSDDRIYLTKAIIISAISWVGISLSRVVQLLEILSKFRRPFIVTDSSFWLWFLIEPDRARGCIKLSSWLVVQSLSKLEFRSILAQFFICWLGIIWQIWPWLTKLLHWLSIACEAWLGIGLQ